MSSSIFDNVGAGSMQQWFVFGFYLFIVALFVAIIAINGVALWKAARNGSKGWFIALLLTNTIVLELLYIFVFSKPKGTNSPAAGSDRIVPPGGPAVR
ncbi:MAG: DUF5652 family protein [bacterium]